MDLARKHFAWDLPCGCYDGVSNLVVMDLARKPVNIAAWSLGFSFQTLL